MSEPEPIIYIVDDDDAVRESVAALVAIKNHRVQTFASADEFLRAYDDRAPACLVVDLRMPGLSGLDLQRELRVRRSSVAVVLMSGYANVATAVEALRGGAVDLIEKPCSIARLWEAISQGLERSRQLYGAKRRVHNLEAGLARLSDDERSVMELSVAGKATKDIARDLAIGLRTAEQRRASVLRKMNCDSLSELVAAILWLRRQKELQEDEPFDFGF